ncbi:hypothetical protein HQ560_16420, partial [bacterium]|nr:hypothetical protein [bacterium]
MEWIARMLDAPFGWVLEAPRDVAIALLAVATSLLLTLVRKWTTNQDRLRRAASDLRTLKGLRREAKRAKDRDAVRRLGATAGMVRGVRLRAEGMPLLVSILPIALLAIWAVQRLDYEPLRAGEEAVIRAYYPLGSVDSLTHLIAPEGVALAEGAVRQVVVDGEGGTNGVASWTFLPTEAVG